MATADMGRRLTAIERRIEQHDEVMEELRLIGRRQDERIEALEIGRVQQDETNKAILRALELLQETLDRMADG